MINAVNEQFSRFVNFAKDCFDASADSCVEMR
jgi:hypothetical protein